MPGPRRTRPPTTGSPSSAHRPAVVGTSTSPPATASGDSPTALPPRCPSPRRSTAIGPSWQRPISHRITWPSGALEIARLNAAVAAPVVGNLARAELRSMGRPAEEQGVVGRRGVLPVGEAQVDGRLCSVVAICAHLGGTLDWNDAERSWDCPLQGSRFSPDGHVLEGPATRPLRLATPRTSDTQESAPLRATAWSHWSRERTDDAGGGLRD
jgi:nitrite reductase/ring-hydroxylating ferredoxin subunit